MGRVLTTEGRTQVLDWVLVVAKADAHVTAGAVADFHARANFGHV